MCAEICTVETVEISGETDRNKQENGNINPFLLIIHRPNRQKYKKIIVIKDVALIRIYLSNNLQRIFFQNPQNIYKNSVCSKPPKYK